MGNILRVLRNTPHGEKDTGDCEPLLNVSLPIPSTKSLINKIKGNILFAFRQKAGLL